MDAAMCPWAWQGRTLLWELLVATVSSRADVRREVLGMADVDDAKTVVESSGNNFHAAVLRVLLAQEWAVAVSPYYADGATGKPREVDLIAEKTFRVIKHLGTLTRDTVNVRLFVECKYVKDITVFWNYALDRESARALVKTTGRMGERNPRTN
jgi:hypothetical protein